MTSESTLLDAWNQLALGARMAFAQQWMGVAAGGLPCGSSILDDHEQIVAVGRNHVYDLPEKAHTPTTSPLQYTRVAHAEINALALVPSNREPQLLTLWTTQHPFIMCAAALRFIGIGKVCYIADDPSDVSPPGDIIASRGNIPYEALGDRLWWTVSKQIISTEGSAPRNYSYLKESRKGASLEENETNFRFDPVLICIFHQPGILLPSLFLLAPETLIC
jgi:tRNA(Arg) A34 adenosine deaminase TadA